MQLLRALSISGARTDDDTPVASGFATFYRPSTLTLAVVYKDSQGLQAWVQPVALDETGRAEVWTADQVRMIVQDASGVTVLDGDPANTVRAEQVELVEAGWPNSRNVSAALAALYASLGGFDGRFRTDPAGTDRLIKTWLAELCVSVKDFGAKGDGLADDLPAFLSAYANVTQHSVKGGRGVLYVPPGIYRLSSVFPIVDTITMLGAGRESSKLLFFGADSNGITITGVSGLSLAHFGINFDGLSLGAGLRVKNCSQPFFDHLQISPGGSSAGFNAGLLFDVTGPDVGNPIVDGCEIGAATVGGVIARGISSYVNPATTSGRLRNLRVMNSVVSANGVGDGAGYPFDLAMLTGAQIYGCRVVGGSLGMRIGSLTPSMQAGVDGCEITGCDFMDRTVGADIQVSADSDRVRTWANEYSSGGGVTDLHTADVPGINDIYGDLSRNPVGSRGVVKSFNNFAALPQNDTYTPNLDRGNYFFLRVNNSTFGHHVTVNAPTSSYPLYQGQELVMHFQVIVDESNFVPPFVAGTGWGQTDFQDGTVPGPWGLGTDESEEAGGSASFADDKGKKRDGFATSVSYVSGHHTIFRFVYDGTYWRATSRWVSQNP